MNNTVRDAITVTPLGNGIGAGQCVLRAPRIFDQRDDGMVILLDDSPAPELHAAAHKAADLCPSQAITIEEIA